MRAAPVALVVCACATASAPRLERPVGVGPPTIPAVESSSAAIYASRVARLAEPAIGEGGVVGLTIGIVDATHVEHVGLGRTSEHGPTPNADTVYEIGSLTKLFTGILLAALEVEGADLSTPASEWLGQRLPARKKRPIQLLDLASHTSGLPTNPDGFRAKDPLRPYDDVSAKEVLRAASNAKLRRKPGARYEYSNFGFGLLGLAIERKLGQSYEAALAERVLGPLGLERTRSDLEAVQGHDADRAPVPPWRVGEGYAAAGALRSTARDLTRLLLLQLRGEGPLARALEQASTPVHALSAKEHTPLVAALPAAERRRHAEISSAYGWHVLDGGRRFMTGRTGGFHASVGFDPDAGVGVVVLSNTASMLVDRVANAVLELVTGGHPEPVVPRAELLLQVDALDRYTGTYVIGPDFALRVRRDEVGLFLEVADQPTLRLHAASATEFFFRGLPAKLTFVLDEGGDAKALILRQSGRTFRGKRN
ncbi:MAG: serine hydrolase [Deltaproteobacteria bacterium]|nr:serine hydrolase [Deltaproteobacteria bacterium]